MERRRSTDVTVSGDRRRGDRRQTQAAVLHFRRATDRRMNGAQADALLQRRALDLRLRTQVDLVQLPAPRETVELDRVVDLDAERPSGRCPECGVPCDPLWLVRHYVEAHPTWP